ncbi:O-methyltransferase [Fibrobacter sp. UWH9]|uniref:methyltransferase n=1 Tax=unclassified Fibrobacter TaxID=2634177 RepID=UPI00091B9BE8|nr:MULTISPECIES: methyltransferase [Fibrobacter]MDO4947646.1 methyltransferase [Fibrobacter sp.]MCL4100856.1 L-tyrosine C(3)-methyltransferase [Fibrobacter succinogenes]OWV08136.1 SAM-dependent methyltransferase [Fibrobacter sp. UWH3]OWV15351.1 SAM-dependent methyltransferase [Fibrobacter sp. UWH1]SHG96690.1 O-methyltransferase [Fibrobacter sp. UWH9]
MFDFYINDNIDAVNAKFEAQKIAFAPLSFQAARALRNLGILDEISNARKKGIKISELSQKLNISLYGIGVLVEMGLGMGAIKVHKDSDDDDLRLTLGKIGFFLMKDEMTQVNMDFSQDICYRGAENLEESILKGKPAGLPHLGPWKTVYEGLSQLTEQEKKSWFGFDHFYSDLAFPEALPIVFEKPVGRLFDIGGNTAKWAISCCKYNADVKVSIIDLPGQTAVAEKNAAAAGFAERINTLPCNVLDETTAFPTGANAVWMSQFLDCFSLEEITKILTKIRKAAAPDTDVYVLEPLWDKQRFEAAAYSLQATSLYFTCIANGNSKMYRYEELKKAIEVAGFELKEAHHNVGPNAYSLLRFRIK